MSAKNVAAESLCKSVTRDCPLVDVDQLSGDIQECAFAVELVARFTEGPFSEGDNCLVTSCLNIIAQRMKAVGDIESYTRNKTIPGVHCD